MNYDLAVIFSFSIAIAAIIGLLRFKRISPIYYPFLICVWIAFANETLSYVLTRVRHSTVINIDIYSVVEALLFTWQFRNWGLLRRPKWLFSTIMCALVIFWIIESLFIGKLHSAISYYRIFYSFFIAVMSIYEINEQINQEKKSLIKNSIFLICMAFVIYYTFNVIVGLFWLYGLHMSVSFQRGVVAILIYLNLFANLIYALAVLWMPSKHRFSLSY